MPDDESIPAPPGGEPLILPRRKTAPLREASLEAARASELADLAESFRALSDRFEAGELAPAGVDPASVAADAEARAARRWKKTGRPELEGVPRGRRVSSRAVPNRLKRPARKAARKRSFLVWIAAQAFGFGLVLLGYYAGQQERGAGPGGGGSPGEPATTATAAELARPAVSRVASERAFETVNVAMAAARAGDADRARQTLEDAQRQELAVPGVDYRLALLALQRGDLREAKLRLDCARAAGQEVAACCYVRAMLAGAIGDYARASEECSRAVYAEPFEARYLFFWAECLRRNGRLEKALERFEEALTRPASPADHDYMVFKMRLAKIEAGRSGDFAAELAGQVASEKPGEFWLLTAAALALERNDPAGAAAHLERASHLLPAADFDLATRDYLLISHSAEKEVARYFRRSAAPVSPSPNVAAITVDPISWTLQTADPAGWPPAANSR